jgi:hypothetical protein
MHQMARRSPIKRVAAAVSDRAGLLPPREVKVRVLRALPTVRLRAAEAREVARARRRLGRGVVADTVTVIPSIGRPELIDAVTSALAQTIDDHRVVVVSDGCDLPPLPADDRLTVVTLRRRYGSAALPRNVGIRATHSRYVAFLDDDNVWRSDHLQRLRPTLAAGADLAYSALEWVDAHGRSLGTLSIPYDRSRMRDQNVVDTNTIVVRRSRRARFRVVPRRRGDATFEDWELAWRLSRRGTVVHVAVPTVRVRVHSGSQFIVPGVDELPTTVALAAGR